MSRKQKHAKQLRTQIAREAARLMYEEGVVQYLDAKRMATRRVVGHSSARKMRHRPGDLPSNGEIKELLLELAELTEGHTRLARLFAMRVLALETMRELLPFSPRLIGSVSTGHVRRGSDIDIHVFADDLEAIELHLFELGWAYELVEVTIEKNGGLHDYVHAHVSDTIFPVELCIYKRSELRITGRSSTDGKRIIRLKPKQLEDLLERDHPVEWDLYQRTGEIAKLEELRDQEELLLSMAQVEELLEQED